MVTKLSSEDWTNVFHFTATNENCCDQGDRVPALFIHKYGFFHFATSLNDDGDYFHQHFFVLGKTYHVTIQQSIEDNKYWYEISIDGDSILREENKKPKSYSIVHLYTSDPWHNPFSSDLGNVCNVKIQQGGEF